MIAMLTASCLKNLQWYPGRRNQAEPCSHPKMRRQSWKFRETKGTRNRRALRGQFHRRELIRKRQRDRLPVFRCVLVRAWVWGNYPRPEEKTTWKKHMAQSPELHRPGVVHGPMTQNENLVIHEALGRIHKEEIKHELKTCGLVTQSCPTLCDPMECRLLCPWKWVAKG